MSDIVDWLIKAAGSILTSQDLQAAGATPAEALAGPAVSMTLGSAYSIDEDRAAHVAKLLGLCEEAVRNPCWEAHDGKTYCNRAADFIAEGMGHKFWPGLLADDMLRDMRSNPLIWRQENDLGRLWKHSLRGALSFVGVEEEPHGHLTAIAPLPMQTSGSWGGLVPVVAHVGIAPNGLVRISKAYDVAKRPLLRGYVLEASIA